MKEYTINGAEFNTIETFYTGIQELFTAGLDWEFGRNLDALADILVGGFGMHEVDEPIKVTWINMEQSRAVLSKKFFDALVDTFASAENVTFERKAFD